MCLYAAAAATMRYMDEVEDAAESLQQFSWLDGNISSLPVFGEWLALEAQPCALRLWPEASAHQARAIHPTWSQPMTTTT